MRHSLLTSLFLALLITQSPAHADAFDVYGKFLTEEGDSHITISDCGDSTPCGRIAWINPATLEEGQTADTVRAEGNGELLMGMQILSRFEQGKNGWRKGKIYDPKTDKTYSSRLKRMDSGDLQVKGCIGFICQTQVWKTVDL